MKSQYARIPEQFQQIVIVGGGFAGVSLAQRLERLLSAQPEIIVLGADNHLVFSPMLPEVVGRTISPLHVVVPGRQLTRRTKWLEARVSRIDRENNEAHYVLRDGTASSIRYTHLVLACGAARIDVDSHQRFGLIEYDVAAGTQLHDRREHGVELIFDAVA